MKNENLKWIIIFSVIVVLSVLAWYISGRFTREYTVAEIAVEGKIIKTIDLSTIEESYEFTVGDTKNGFNKIRAEKGKIAVIDADCADKICVNQGYISDGRVPVVCLPHKLTITIKKSGINEFDAVVGGGK